MRQHPYKAVRGVLKESVSPLLITLLFTFSFTHCFTCHFLKFVSELLGQIQPTCFAGEVKTLILLGQGDYKKYIVSLCSPVKSDHNRYLLSPLISGTRGPDKTAVYDAAGVRTGWFIVTLIRVGSLAIKMSALWWHQWEILGQEKLLVFIIWTP